MKEEISENTRKCIELYEKLCPKMQNAMLWIISNLADVNEMCQGKKLTDEKWTEYMNHAVEQQDMLAIALLEYKRIYDDVKRQENCQDEE